MVSLRRHRTVIWSCAATLTAIGISTPAQSAFAQSRPRHTTSSTRAHTNSKRTTRHGDPGFFPTYGLGGLEPIEIIGTTSAGVVGQTYSSTLYAYGGWGSYSWSVASGALPGGLSLSSTGTISGTPTTAGGSGFEVKVTDAFHGATEATYTIWIGSASASSSATPCTSGSGGLTCVS
jgi:putative Ig domain-containing protein